jgi:hypothetical protein
MRSKLALSALVAAGLLDATAIAAASRYPGGGSAKGPARGVPDLLRILSDRLGASEPLIL